MSQPIDVNGVPIEQRAQSVASTTDGIPIGTMLTVPSVPPTGPVPNAPVVGATTVSWKTDVQTLVAAIGLPVLTAVLEYIESLSNMNGLTRQQILHVAGAAFVGALLAYLRKTNNTVAR